MKLVITVPWTERLGGGEIMLWRFLTHLDATRFETTVVFLEPGSFERHVAAMPDIRTVVVPIARLRDVNRVVRATVALTRVLRRIGPDLVLNWVAKAQLYGASAAILSGARNRIVWWQHTIPEKHWMDRLATALPARAVGCSSTATARAQARLRPHRRTFVVHPGVETDRVQPVPVSELGIPSQRAVIGIVGRLQPWKGQDRVLDAVSELRRSGHDVHALIVGGDAYGLSPEYPRLLSRRVAALGLDGRVTMTGHVDHPAPYIAAMDVLVSASTNEPFGMALLEGMAQEVPVVAVGDAGPRDIVEDGVSGVLVSAPDGRLIAGAVAGLLVDDGRRRLIARAGREVVLRNFTARRMTERLQDALEELAREDA